MSKFTNRIEKYYKAKKDTYSKKVDLLKSYNTKFSVDDDNNHIIELLDDSGNTVLKAYYDLIGFYNLSNSVWYWGWNIDLADKKLTSATLKISEFPKYIKKNYKEFQPVEAEDYHFRTSMGNFYTSLDKIHNLIKLAMFILKGEWYIAVCSGRDGKTTTCDPGFNAELEKSPIIRFEYLLIKKILKIR